jgi:hypothetical protein
MMQFALIAEVLGGLALLIAAFTWLNVARTGGDRLGDRISPRRVRAAALGTVIAFGFLGVAILAAAVDRLG